MNRGISACSKSWILFVNAFPNEVQFPSAQRALLIGAVVISLVGEAAEGEDTRISWNTRAMQIETICCLTPQQTCSWHREW